MLKNITIGYELRLPLIGLSPLKKKLRLRQFEARMTVAQYGSVTRAAKELSIIQSAVSRLLADLGTTFGFHCLIAEEGQLVQTQVVPALQSDIRPVWRLTN